MPHICSGLQSKWVRTAINGNLGRHYLHLSIPPGQDSVQLMSFFRINATGVTRLQTLIRHVLTIKNATGTILAATGLLFTTLHATGSNRGVHSHASSNGPQELPQPHGFGTEYPHTIDDGVRIFLRARLSPASRFQSGR